MEYICSFINQYLNNGYSIIPIDNDKRPHIYWKKFQYRKAEKEDIFEWLDQFSTYNIGIVTGQISRLAVVDVDDLSVLPLLKEKIPEIDRTTRVRTLRGYHYYFRLNGEQVASTGCLFGKRLELKSNGSYIVAPPSKINNHHYTYEVPLSKILPFPKTLISPKTTEQNSPEQYIHKSNKISKYHGHKMDCIRQILKRELREGERNNSLFILYNLLLQNHNTRAYSRRIVRTKNGSLENPLSEKEMEKIWRKSYCYGCSGIRKKLPFIRCERCTYRFKGGRLPGENILVRNIRILPELTSTQRSIICLLGTVFDGEKPSINMIAKTAGMNYLTVKKAIEALKKKNIIDYY